MASLRRGDFSRYWLLHRWLPGSVGGGQDAWSARVAEVCLRESRFPTPRVSPLTETQRTLSGGACTLQEQLKQMGEHVARLQDALRSERTKCSHLQLRSNHQEAELRRLEQLVGRLKERLMLLTDRQRERAPAIEVLNVAPGGQGRRQQPTRPIRSTSKQEEAALRLMLERREAELREAMKLRHSLTTLLHALRVDMEHVRRTLVGDGDGDEAGAEGDVLEQAEAALGDHVTGGVVQSWRRVQNRLDEVLSEDPGHAGAGTDHDELVARLETDLKESQQLVRLQQQLLQDSVASPVPSELDDSYFLDEWERLRGRWAQLDHQRRTFERERESFTDAAIRLSRERCEFERQKASLLKEQYLRGWSSVQGLCYKL
ncbi:afadin- and alpha-actinin-binding protein [Brachionichthys hirsutus]|uniref:afadin- and alpha-actinin-binding protein n=1 Tax=Brachionichthys hirsutus TaxID=412623 RepID=UPI0036051462